MFAFSLNIKLFYLTHRILSSATTLIQNGNEEILCIPQNSIEWGLAIRLFNVLSTILVRGALTLSGDTVGVFYRPSRLGKYVLGIALNFNWWWCTISGVLEIGKYTFIAITLKSTQTQSGNSNYYGSMSQVGLLGLDKNISCLNFLDEAWWFLSLRIFGLLSSAFGHFHNVSGNMSSGLPQVLVKHGNLPGTSNYVIYWIHGVICSDSVSHNLIKVLKNLNMSIGKNHT